MTEQKKSKGVSESRLWSWLSGSARKHFKHHLHMHRIENSVMAGMPDVEGCLAGRQFWLELKCVSRPASSKAHIKCRFQPQQIPWLKARQKAGGVAFVLLQIGGSADAARYLVPANNAWVLAGGLMENDLHIYSAIDPKSDAVAIIQAAANF